MEINNMGVMRSYLNQDIVRKTRSKAKAQMIIGISMVAFYSIGYLCVFEGELPQSYYALITALMMPAFYLIYCAYNHYSYISKAERYDKIFCKDKDGIIQ